MDNYYHYFEQFGLKQRTGIDLPGEAGTIMHKKEDMGNVELATVAFGQSFQITAIQLLTTASSIINGGNRVDIIGQTTNVLELENLTDETQYFCFVSEDEYGKICRYNTEIFRPGREYI